MLPLIVGWMFPVIVSFGAERLDAGPTFLTFTQGDMDPMDSLSLISPYASSNSWMDVDTSSFIGAERLDASSSCWMDVDGHSFIGGGEIDAGPTSLTFT